MQKGFARKLYIYLFASFFVVVITTIFMSNIGPLNKLRNEYTFINLHLLSKVNENVDGILKAIDSELINLSQDPRLSIYMNPLNHSQDNIQTLSDLQEHLRNMKYINQNIDSIYLYSAYDNKILTDSQYKTLENFYDIEWLDMFKNSNNSFEIIPTRKIKIEGVKDNTKNVISILRKYPITAHQNQVQGAIVVNIDENTINSILANNKSERLLNIFIVKPDGIVLSHSNKKDVYLNYSNEKYMTEVLQSDSEGFITENDNFVFYSTSAYTGWKYVSVIPASQMSRLYNTFDVMMILVTCILIAGSLLLLLFVLRITFKPIHSFVTNVASRVGNVGDDVDKVGDLGELERVFGVVINDYEKVKEEMKDYVPVMKWRLIMDILMGYKTDASEIEKNFDFLNISLYKSSFIVLVMESDSLSDEGAELLISDIEKIVNQDCKGAVIKLYNDKIAVLISFEEFSENTIVTIAIAEMIKNTVIKTIESEVAIGVGNVVSDYKDITNSYFDALEALKYRVIMGKNPVITIDDIVVNDNSLFHIASMTPDITACGERLKVSVNGNNHQ